MNAITIETINFDKVTGFYVTLDNLPKTAVNVSYIVENETLQMWGVYKIFKTNKTYLRKTI